jgi:hypothetical protein
MSNLLIKGYREELHTGFIVDAWHTFQEKQSSHKGFEHSCSWFEGPLFLYSIFAIIFHPVFGLLMETALVVLAQPSIHCYQISLYNSHRLDLWNNVLGYWLQNVSHHSVIKTR